MDKLRFEATARNSAGEKSKRTSETLQARGSPQLGKVASGSARQGLWLGDRKVGSQVIGKDRSQLPGRGGRRASDRTKKRLPRFGVGLALGEREEQVACLPLAMTEEAEM